MKKMVKSDGFKGIILLSSLPPYYASLTENLRLNNDKYTYGDIVNTLRTYVPERQKYRNKNGPTNTGKTQHGSLENPIVLNKVEKDRFGHPIDTSKVCQYCKRKGWRGIGHTENECRTKQREALKANPTGVKRTEFDLDEDIHSIVGGVDVNALKIHVVTIKLISHKNGWYEFDSGAQAHTTNELHRLVDKRTSSVLVSGHDGHSTKAQYERDIYLPHNGHTIRLRNVLYHPQFSNLVSGLKVAKVCTLQLDKERVRLYHGKDEVYNMERDNTGWWIKPDDLNGVSIKEVGTDAQKQALRELHETYGHISFSLVKGLPEGRQYKEINEPRCIACELGKSTKPEAPKSPIGPIRTTRPLEQIHCDLIGPMSHEWLGRKYALTILDDYSRFCSVIPLRGKDKNSVGSTLIRTIKEWERATGNIVYQIQADWGGEFRNSVIQDYVTEKGIKLKETIPYHSETNAAIERLNRTIQEMGRVALIAAGQWSPGYWGDAAQWAAYTKNRIPHNSLRNKIPIEVFLNKTVNRGNLRPFGEKVVAHAYLESNDKMVPRGIHACIIGYTETYGIYQVISPTGKRFLAKNPTAVKKEEEEEDTVLPIEYNAGPYDRRKIRLKALCRRGIEHVTSRA